MGKDQGYGATEFETRLRVVAEVALRQSQAQTDGLQGGIQRLKIVRLSRIWIDNGAGFHLLHDAGQHSKGFTALTVVERSPGSDNAKPFSLAHIPHHPWIAAGELDHVGIRRIGIACVHHVGLNVECLHQHLHHMHALDVVLRIELSLVTVERRHAVSVL